MFQIFRNVKFEGTVSAGDVFGVGDFLAVEPDVGAVIDAVEMQPISFCRGGCGGWRGEVGAKPPGTGEGAAFGHVDVGEECFFREIHAGKIFEVGAVGGIGERFVGDQDADYRGGNVGAVPFGGVEAGSGDSFGGAFVVAGRLDLPVFVEKSFGVGVLSCGALRACGDTSRRDQCGRGGGEQAVTN